MLAANPAWLWSPDGSRVLVANAAAAAILGAEPTQLRERRWPAADPLAAHIARLAATLPTSGAARLERFRSLGTGFGRPLACACSRFKLGDGSDAVLLVAAEPASVKLTLADRVRRLFADLPVAVFAPDGALIHAGAQVALRDKTSLGEIGADALAAQALRGGEAGGPTQAGVLVLMRLGSGADTVLLATVAEPDARETASTPDVPAPTPSPASVAPPPVAAATHAAGRRHPLRFVWQMDVDGSFTLGSDEFADAVGPQTVALIGRPWNDIAETLGLDPAGMSCGLWSRARPGAASRWRGRSTARASGWQSSSRACLFSIATGSSAVIVDSACAAT